MLLGDGEAAHEEVGEAREESGDEEHAEDRQSADDTIADTNEDAEEVEDDEGDESEEEEEEEQQLQLGPDECDYCEFSPKEGFVKCRTCNGDMKFLSLKKHIGR